MSIVRIKIQEEILEWAKQRDLLKEENAPKQLLKLQEEVGELAKAILKDDTEEFVDAIGDCVVVLTNLARLGGYNIEDCINSAFNVINKRTGKMQNGTFVKDEK